MPDVFVSYSRKDATLVDLFCQRAEERGKTVWIDRNEIQPGANWSDDAFAAIAASDSFLFCISPNSLSSPICDDELKYAISLGKKPIPVVVSGTTKSSVPETLALLNWIFCRNESEVSAAVEQAVKAIETDYEWTKSKTRFLNRALEWQKKNQDRCFLLRGRDLGEAESWMEASAGKQAVLPSVLLRYLQRGRSAETQSLRKTVSILTIGIVVVSTLAVFSYIEYRKALSRQFAAESFNHVDDEIDVALNLATRANMTADTVQARSALAMALEHNPRVIGVLHAQQGAVRSVAFSPDGHTFASSGMDSSIKLWDLESRSAQGPPLLAHEAPVASVVFDPKDASILASGGQDAHIFLWNVKNRSIVKPLDGHSQAIASMAFDPNGDFLVSGSHDQTFIVWDVHTGKKICRSPEQDGTVYGVSVNADGHSIAATMGGGLVSVWDARTCTMIGPAMNAHLPGGALAVSYDPSGVQLLRDTPTAS